MNTHTTKLEEIAYGLATSQLISCDNNFKGSWFERYQYLTENVSNLERLEGWEAWQPFDNLEWADVVGTIDCKAELFLSAMRESLGLAKQGLILAAINGPLQSLFKEFDIQRLVDISAKDQVH